MNVPLEPKVADLRVESVEIADGTYWVGKRAEGSVFHANPYLRCFRGTTPETERANAFNLLIDPGSSSDFSSVHTKVTSLIGGLDKLSALFVNHQDPDVGSSSTIISARYAPRASIICSEDTWRLIVHSNLPRDRFVPTEKFTKGIKLPTGHRLIPVPSPYCHFRGAVMLYDPETRVLFTGDLFGGLTDGSDTRLVADESDWSGIRAFHQIYMPTNAALARTVAAIRALEPKVEVLAPQHGRVITGELVPLFLDRMSRLQVGLDIMDEASDPSHLQAWNAVAQRVLGVAREFLGPQAERKLVENPALHDTLRFEEGRVSIESLGKWTVEQLVESLCAQEPMEIAGPIMVEATMAAADYELPTPHLDLEGTFVANESTLFEA
jgi:flavorubredoxin